MSKECPKLVVLWLVSHNSLGRVQQSRKRPKTMSSVVGMKTVVTVSVNSTRP